MKARKPAGLANYFSEDGPELRPISIIRRRAEVLDLMGQWKMAEEFLVEEIKRTSRPRSALWLKSDLAQIFIHQGQPDRALGLLTDFGAVGGCDNQRLLCRVLGLLGTAHRQRGEGERALELFDQQLRIAEMLGEGRLLSQARGSIGNILADSEDWPAALECFLWRLENDRKRGDLQGVCLTMGNVGLMYLNLGDPLKAEELFGQQLRLADAIGDLRLKATALGNLGILYGMQARPSEARENFEHQLEICRRLGDWRGVSGALGNIGILLERQDRCQEAVEYFRQKIDICRNLGDQRGLIVGLSGLASVLAKSGDEGGARGCLGEAIGLARQLGLKVRADELSALLNRLADISQSGSDTRASG